MREIHCSRVGCALGAEAERREGFRSAYSLNQMKRQHGSSSSRVPCDGVRREREPQRELWHVNQLSSPYIFLCLSIVHRRVSPIADFFDTRETTWPVPITGVSSSFVLDPAILLDILTLAGWEGERRIDAVANDRDLIVARRRRAASFFTGSNYVPYLFAWT